LSGKERVFWSDPFDGLFEPIAFHGASELGSKPDITGVIRPVFVEKIFFE